MSLSVVILTKNQAQKLSKTLDSVNWAKEVLVIDNGSRDATVDIAAEAGARVISDLEPSFEKRRNLGLEKALNNWIFYLDTDEVVSTALAKEIQEIVAKDKPGVFRVKRENYLLGTKMYPDEVERLFHKDLLKGWKGDVHETPIFNVDAKILENALLHYTHTNITSMLVKTNGWSEIEANLKIDAHHPPVQWWRLIRMMVTTAWKQFISLNLLKYGRAGLFEGYFQIIDKLIVYVKLWELQKMNHSLITK